MDTILSNSATLKGTAHFLGPLGLAGFMSTIASIAYPDRFATLLNDYIVTPSIANAQIGFFQ